MTQTQSGCWATARVTYFFSFAYSDESNNVIYTRVYEKIKIKNQSLSDGAFRCLSSLDRWSHAAVRRKNRRGETKEAIADDVRAQTAPIRAE